MSAPKEISLVIVLCVLLLRCDAFFPSRVSGAAPLAWKALPVSNFGRYQRVVCLLSPLLLTLSVLPSYQTDQPIPHPNPTHQHVLSSSPTHRDLEPNNNLLHVFDELIASILKVFPDVLRASRPANPDLVMVEPPSFSAPKSAKEWAKGSKGFHEMDQAAAFEAKYLGDSHSVSAKIKLSKIAALLEDIDSRDLLDSLDEYMMVTNQSQFAAANPIEVAEKFIVEGLIQSFKPIDGTVNPLKVEKDAVPFHSPVKLSALRKVLKNNPEYFK